jgi:large subunit ribosomal protein L21e
MVKRAGAFRSRTRHKLKKVPRTSGKVSVTKFLQKFKEGENVIIKHEPTIQDGMPHPRFKGLTGKVIGMQGYVYKVVVMDGSVRKILLVAPVHLLKVKQ